MDKNDACPTVFGSTKTNGCPDRDNDGIADKEDKCPDVAGVAERQGCPKMDESKRQEIQNKIAFAAKSIQFETGKDIIKPISYKELDEVVAIMKEYDFVKFVIAGHTDNLGNVMKESATTAMTYLQANAKKIGVDPTLFNTKSVHMHVPEGAVPKDGPSAGITILTALSSAYTGRKVKPFLAMTGEITLRGQVLPVGGIKEKILAAKRAGMKEIILCWQNEKDVNEIDQAFIKGVKFYYVKNMQQVLDLALV